MSTGGLILLGAFLAASLAVILWPLIIQVKARQQDPDAVVIERLREQHEGILLAIRDLDFDQQTGKINQTDYAVQRERLLQSGIEILKQIDAHESEIIESAVMAKRTAPKKERVRTSRKSKAAPS